ncbi:hypothetical protein [Pseudarthrobacter sp. N5]|uniref:hypothetical protein n=1 Tax=Pseudarthrobacter sp. N5 TaxID=3418416 RepID=UPI003CF065E4
MGQSANADLHADAPLGRLALRRRAPGRQRIDGIPERINIVGILKELKQYIGNAKSYYNFETAVREKALEVPPPRIDVKINLVRGPGVKTPAKIRVGAWADGKQFIDRDFENIVGRGQAVAKQHMEVDTFQETRDQERIIAEGLWAIRPQDRAWDSITHVRNEKGGVSSSNRENLSR